MAPATLHPDVRASRTEQNRFCSVRNTAVKLYIHICTGQNFSYKSSRTSSTQTFVNATRPALAVVSVGQDSPYGHPHAEVLARWRDAGALVLTTGERGAVTVSTDGEDLRVETYVRE